MSTLRDILERAHCCTPLLEFAGRCMRQEAPSTTASDQCWCGEQRADLHQFTTFEYLWNAIDRHDWLFWLMSRCPEQFEDSRRDVIAAARSLADFACMVVDLRQRYDTSERACALESCRLIRQYVRLRP